MRLGVTRGSGRLYDDVANKLDPGIVAEFAGSDYILFVAPSAEPQRRP